MAWTELTRHWHQRDGLRHAGGTSDAEWVVIEQHLQPPACRGRSGRYLAAWTGLTSMEHV
jgi:hypothetical protein